MIRLLAFIALPLVLAAGMLGSSTAAQAAPAALSQAAAAAQPSSTCILGIICVASGSSSATASASSATPSPSPTTASPSVTPSPSPTSASASATPSPSATQSPSADPEPSAGPTASPTPSATASPGATPSASGAASTREETKEAAAKLAAATPGLVASAATSVLTAGSATLTGFTYQGNVQMPVSGGGTVTMMEFTADDMSLAGDVTDSVTEDGLTTQTSSPSLDFGGDVTLYATQLSGSLLGVPVTFTPSTISAILLSIANLITAVLPITLTDVTTDQPLVIAGSLQTGALSLGFGG